MLWYTLIYDNHTDRQLARHTFLLCCPIQNEISVKLVIFFSHHDLWQPYLLIVSLLYILFCYIVQFKMKYLFIRHIFQPPWSLTTISTYRQLARHSFQLCDKINLPWHTPWLKIHPTCRKSSDAPSVTASQCRRRSSRRICRWAGNLFFEKISILFDLFVFDLRSNAFEKFDENIFRPKTIFEFQTTFLSDKINLNLNL